MTGAYERYGGYRDRERPEEEEETLEAPERCVATRRKADGVMIHCRGGGYIVVPYPYLVPFGGDSAGTMLLLKVGQQDIALSGSGLVKLARLLRDRRVIEITPGKGEYQGIKVVEALPVSMDGGEKDEQAGRGAGRGAAGGLCRAANGSGGDGGCRARRP